jgi:hypothetical protein
MKFAQYSNGVPFGVLKNAINRGVLEESGKIKPSDKLAVIVEGSNGDSEVLLINDIFAPSVVLGKKPTRTAAMCFVGKKTDMVTLCGKNIKN